MLKTCLILGIFAVFTADRLSADDVKHEIKPEDVQVTPIVDALDGTSGYSANATKKLKQGDQIKWKETVETGADTGMRVDFESGIQLLVGSGAKFTLQQESSDGETVPEVLLENGEARVLVDTAKNPPLKNHVKFYFRTPSAVLGVKGTDFVVEINDGKTELHTLQGTVDVARDLKTMRSTSQGVAESKMIELQGEKATEGGEKSFEKADFLKAFFTRQPKLEGLSTEAEGDYQNGNVKKKFRELRERLAEETNLKNGIPSTLEFKGRKTAPSARPSK